MIEDRAIRIMLVCTAIIIAVTTVVVVSAVYGAFISDKISLVKGSWQCTQYKTFYTGKTAAPYCVEYKRLNY